MDKSKNAGDRGIDFKQMTSDFFIEYTKKSGNFDMPVMHYHDNYEIYYLLSGERNYLINDKIYTVKKGDIVLLKPFDIHRTTSSTKSPYERIVLNLKDKLFSNLNKDILDANMLSFFNNTSILKLNNDEQNVVEQILFRMIKENSQMKKWYINCFKALLVELLVFLDRCADAKRLDIQNYNNNSDKYKKILSIISYINEHYSEEMSLSSISKKFFIVPGYLARIFKEYTGFTCIEYINNVRTREACKLLSETNLKISEISEMVGYKNLTHFERVFNKICGSSPSKYKRTNKN